MSVLLLCGLVVLVANLGILGLSFKLYTEYVKDRAQDRRAAPHSGRQP